MRLITLPFSLFLEEHERPGREERGGWGCVDSAVKMTINLEKCTLTELAHIRQLLAEHISPNESIEEVKTADLQYIATDYFIALHHLKEHVDRLNSLQQAQQHFESFFDWLEGFKLMKRPPMAEHQVDAVMSRQHKISRFNKVKELKSLCHPDTLKSDDEESARQFWMNWIKLKGLLALEEVEFLVAEKRLLSRRGCVDGVKNTPLAIDHPPSKVVNVHRPFVLTREHVRDRVFKPGHNLPTMSIDEFLDLEMKRGNMLQQQSTAAGRTDPETDLDFDQETQKLRERDERWDWIRKGSGNTYNRS